nr:aspartate-rich protein 1-like [Macaca nemestrina]
MGNILTCCVCPKVSSNCGWHRGKVASSYESDIYEAVAATKSASTTVEPGKLDVGATEGHDLQHISNQKMPTAPVPDLAECDLDIVEEMLPEMMDYTAQNSNPPVPDLEECDLDILENKMLPDMMDYTAQNSNWWIEEPWLWVFPARAVTVSSSLVLTPELSPGKNMLGPMGTAHTVTGPCVDAQKVTINVCHKSPVHGSFLCVLPASPEDNLSFVSLSRSEDYDGGGDDDDDDAQILPSRVRASPEDNPSLVSLPRSEDGDCDDDDDEDDDDTQILPSRVQAWPEDRLFLRCSPRYKDDDDDDDADCDDDCDDDDDVHITAWKENDLTLESISDEETYPG